MHVNAQYSTVVLHLDRCGRTEFLILLSVGLFVDGPSDCVCTVVRWLPYKQTTWDVDSKRTRARTSDLTLLRHVLAGGCMTAGRWFPEGTRVGVNAVVVQRDEKIFGEDAEESVPE